MSLLLTALSVFVFTFPVLGSSPEGTPQRPSCPERLAAYSTDPENATVQLHSAFGLYTSYDLMSLDGEQFLFFGQPFAAHRGLAYLHRFDLRPMEPAFSSYFTLARMPCFVAPKFIHGAMLSGQGELSMLRVNAREPALSIQRGLLRLPEPDFISSLSAFEDEGRIRVFFLSFVSGLTTVDTISNKEGNMRADSKTQRTYPLDPEVTFIQPISLERFVGATASGKVMLFTLSKDEWETKNLGTLPVNQLTALTAYQGPLNPRGIPSMRIWAHGLSKKNKPALFHWDENTEGFRPILSPVEPEEELLGISGDFRALPSFVPIGAVARIFTTTVWAERVASLVRKKSPSGAWEFQIKLLLHNDEGIIRWETQTIDELVDHTPQVPPQ